MEGCNIVTVARPRVFGATNLLGTLMRLVYMKSRDKLSEKTGDQDARTIGVNISSIATVLRTSESPDRGLFMGTYVNVCRRLRDQPDYADAEKIGVGGIIQVDQMKARIFPNNPTNVPSISRPAPCLSSEHGPIPLHAATRPEWKKR